jgi:hypothetical protein
MSYRRNTRTNKKNIKNTKNIYETNETINEIHNNQDKELEKRECYSDKFFRYSYDGVIFILNFTYKTTRFILNVSGIYLLWICLHYTASHLYIHFCVPNTLIGFMMSPFMTATPHCLGLRWVVYNAASMINNMWIILGTWICSTILIINNDRTSESTS